MTSTRLLFRQEALEFEREGRRWGEVVLIQPIPTALLAWFLTTVFGLILIYLATAQYSRKETVAGYLTPNSGTAKIFADQRGTIRAVHVKEGDKVAEGQPLLTIETNRIAGNGSDVNSTLLETLSSQKNLLTKNINGERNRADSERERLAALIQGLNTEVAQLHAQMALQEQRIEVAQSDLTSADQLASKGYITAVEHKRRLAHLLEQKQNLNALSQQVAARRNQLTETRFALEQLPTVTAQKVQSLETELSGTEQRITEINGRLAYVLRAPMAGYVSTLQATVGQSTDPQRLQLEIIPSGAVMQAELFVPTRAMGFIEPRQQVRILYDAFPYQHFGTYSGHITNVSQTILTSSDVSGPIALKEPAYRITANLDRLEIDAYGKKIPLQAGMLLRADIILDKRPLMKWFLDPLLRVRM